MNDFIHRHGSWSCPGCGAKLNASTPALSNPDPREPEPGDLTVCYECEAVLTYLSDGVAKLTPLELEGLPADVKANLEGAKKYSRYLLKATTFTARLKEWRRKNPTSPIVIQYQAPHSILVLMGLWDALESGFISVNAAGRDMLEYAEPDKGENQATVTMLRAALDLKEDK